MSSFSRDTLSTNETREKDFDDWYIIIHLFLNTSAENVHASSRSWAQRDNIFEMCFI